MQILTVVLVVGGFRNVSLSEDKEPVEADREKVLQVEVQVVGDEAAQGGGVVFRRSEIGRFCLGVALDVEDGRLEVQRVLPESPAAKAGIKPEDVLLAIEEATLKEYTHLQQLIQASGGKPISLWILRGGKKMMVEVKLERQQAGQLIVIGEGNKGEEKRIQLRLTEPARRPAATPTHPGAGGWRMLTARRAGTGTAR